jgi:hypothetical protein
MKAVIITVDQRLQGGYTATMYVADSGGFDPTVYIAHDKPIAAGVGMDPAEAIYKAASQLAGKPS